MSLKTFESLKLRLTKDRCPFVVTATGTSMEPMGFTECSFDIDGCAFTQKFIVCNNQTQPIILGKDFAAKNCIGIVWTKQGLRKMIDDDGKVIMEVKEQTTDVPLSLTNSIRILPHTIAVAVVECTTPLNSTMDIRADEGFLRDFPNIHVARSYVNNPQQSLAPNCIPFAFTNLSMYPQYLGKDKVVGFAQPIAEDVEVHTLADHEEFAEMLRGPQNHIPVRHKLSIKCLSFLWIMFSLHLQQMFQDQEKWTCRIPTLHQAQDLLLTRSVRDTLGFSLKGMRTLVEHNWLQWTLIRETAL